MEASEEEARSKYSEAWFGRGGGGLELIVERSFAVWDVSDDVKDESELEKADSAAAWEDAGGAGARVVTGVGREG
jgi:hypothetical protein